MRLHDREGETIACRQLELLADQPLGGRHVVPSDREDDNNEVFEKSECIVDRVATV